MDEIEHSRTNAEAGKSLVGRPGRAWPHEELLLRYLGTVFYRSRRKRDETAEPGGSGEYVQAEVSAAPQARTRRWALRRPQSG